VKHRTRVVVALLIIAATLLLLHIHQPPVLNPGANAVPKIYTECAESVVIDFQRRWTRNLCIIGNSRVSL
jgi:hypothetical protein